jgi:hypothetical protein
LVGLRDGIFLASGQGRQQDHQCGNPQSHPDQKVFAASHFPRIHGEPLSNSVVGSN